MSNNLVPTQEETTSMMTIADHAFNSKYFDKLGGKSAIFTLMARAREIGMPLLEAVMGGLNIIQGKVEISPRAMNGMIRKAGHKLEIKECTNQRCLIKGTRKDTGEVLEVSFSVEDAKRANIYKGAWITYPDDMCFKSALSKLARRLFPDIISTSYVEGELSAESGKEGNRVSQSIQKEDPKEIVVETVKEEPANTIHGEASSKTREEMEAEAEAIRIANLPIGEEKAKILMDLIGNDQELLMRILNGYRIEKLEDLKEKSFKATLDRVKSVHSV